MIKDLIVNLERAPSRERVSTSRSAIAQSFDAHVSGACFAYDSLPSFTMPDFPSDVLTKMLAASESAARAAIERFEAACKREGVSAEHHLLETAYGTVGPLPEDGAAVRSVGDHAVRRRQRRQRHPDRTGAVRFRPAGADRALYPEGHRSSSTAWSCGWDGSRAATRAINDAKPFLRRAGQRRAADRARPQGARPQRTARHRDRQSSGALRHQGRHQDDHRARTSASPARSCRTSPIPPPTCW